MYSVFYTSGANRQFQRLPSEVASRVREAVEGLVHNPRTPHTEKLAGELNAYRLRVGSYRVLYTIEDATHRVVIYRIRHRRDAYR